MICSFLPEVFAQNERAPLTKDKINQIIDEHFQNSNAPFNWNDTDAYTIWSAAMQSDQMLAIGYKLPSMSKAEFRQNIGNTNFNTSNWEDIRQDIVEGTLQKNATRSPNERLDRTYQLPFGEKNKLPYVYIRVYDLETVEELIARDDIRFVEPSGYTMVDEEGKSGVGCGDYAGAVNAADIVSISDGGVSAIRSWHHDNHNVPCAWANGWKGQGIEIAVMDSGVSDFHPQFGANFTSGNSSVRTMNKVNFYDSISGDDCGHGSSMTGLAAGPYNSTNPSMPVGIAYQADVNAYRVAPNVLLETSAEQNAVAAAYVAAADDADIRITSMSLGYIFSSGAIASAVQYAYNKDLMMFCAAGTSTSFTGWYPVIFPAWMPETVAITGVNDAAIGSRSRCETCHDGPEVDFVTVMERASDDSRKAVSLGNPPGPGQQLTMGYVGGSSAGTASMAGMAAVIWSANPGESREQIYNRMAKAADYYPNRNDNFGWGVVDVCMAAEPSFVPPCDPAYSNSNVEITITNIVFPNSDDGGGDENEWVISIAGQEYFFDVPETGASGNPSLYHNSDVCGSIPMTINLGNSACGETSIITTVASHEDDAIWPFSPDCGSADDNDDHESVNTNTVIDFTTGTFSHSSSAGTFVFTFTTSCTPISNPTVAVSGVRRVCEGDPAPEVLFNLAGGTPNYTIHYNLNGTPQTPIVTASSSATLTVPTTTPGTYTYEVTKVEDATSVGGTTGCYVQTGTYTIEVVASGSCELEILSRVYLQGPLDMSGAIPLMDVALNTGGMIPAMDPHFGTHAHGPNALDARAENTVVDWVLVEIRDGLTNTAVLSSIPALLQRDGDVVNYQDGVSPVLIPYPQSGNYYIAIRHRNHLGVMTNAPVTLTPSQF